MRALLLTSLVIAAVFAALPVPSAAQADTPSCDPAAVLAKAATLKSTGDKQKDMAALLTLQDAISTANIACNGMTFKGTNDKVIMPFLLPKGNYKATLDLGADPSAVSFHYLGTKLCVLGRLGNDSKESLVQVLFDDCKVVIEVNTYGDTSPWAITLEPLQ